MTRKGCAERLAAHRNLGSILPILAKSG